MLPRCVLTVFTETDSAPAISGRDRFVGRYFSTLSSLRVSCWVSGSWGLLTGGGRRNRLTGRRRTRTIRTRCSSCGSGFRRAF